jgi:PIN domain nuclease of toxin-antitoxin system
VGSAAVKLLLDTHIWIWSLEQPERLSKKVSSALTSVESELWLSPISVWELLLLVERQRIQLVRHATARAWIDEAQAKVPLKEASLTREVAFMSRQVRVEHDDPADRFLAATAVVFDLTLVTADDRLIRGRGFRTLANR